MKVTEQRLPQELDKSFIVFKESGESFPAQWHFHPEYELVLITKSSGRRMVGDHIGYFDEGDLVFIGSLLPHVYVNPGELRNDNNYNAEAIVIQFLEDFLGTSFFQIPELSAFKDLLKLSNRGLVIKGNVRTEIRKIMMEMIGMSGIDRLIALIGIFKLLSASTEYELLASSLYAHNMNTNSSEKFSRITEHIMRNFQRDIPLHEIASLASMASATFCKFFKKNYHITFVEYLNTVRIAHACKLLSDNTENIVNIAFNCGFNTINNFNKQFKKVKKMTPKEYRKVYLGV
jgi:AraC-like DNA-binding protein